MKSRFWLPSAVLLGAAAGVCAEPYDYDPAPRLYGAMPAMPGMGLGPLGPEPFDQAPMARRSGPAAAWPRDPSPGSAQPQAQASALPPEPFAEPSDFWGTPRGPMGGPMERGPLAQAADALQTGLDTLTGFLGQKETPNKLQAAAFLDREIAPYFDFDYMAQWVAGASYGRMGEADRKALAAHLESSFLSALGSHLAAYQGQQARVLRPRPAARGAVTVPVGILGPGSYPTRMEFRMYRSADGWKVYDVIANGRSAASYYRQRFQRMGAARAGAPAGAGPLVRPGPEAAQPVSGSPQSATAVPRR